ncbi:MAG TPA: CBS domain-containing protein [Solirubrobacteraceae bacterium]|nr:CBS domain-containing protein [Solirubrobacteraceae bacterium]
MRVREGMSSSVLTVGPSHKLREVARLMSERKVGAAVVMDPESAGPGIITERDILVSLGAGEDPDEEAVAEHLTREVVYAAPDWSLEEAAAAMVHGGFRHLIVLEQGEATGILSVRDIVRLCVEANPTDIAAPLRNGATSREEWLKGIVASGLKL